jgi:CubicO group peptidase (beta-lactamase class C family)
MTMTWLPRLAAASLVTAAICAEAAPPGNFDARVEALRKALGVPGAAITIVENGKTTLARGYGVRDLSAPEPVDADTIFATGSTGKAFTVAALAILVDQGKIGWNDRVIDHMPEFRMYDPWVTREMTIRDLLVHRSGLGLGAGDLLFVPTSDLSRKETVLRLRHIKPETSFRSAYAYDNVLYIVAGQLIEDVTGQSWETFMRQHVLDRAGMRHSTVDDKGRLATVNRARPHARTDGPIRGLGEQKPLDESSDLAANAAPAGGLAISASDMARWLGIQLARGKLPAGDDRLFTEAASQEMWNPVTLQPISERPDTLKPTQPLFYTYALGWDVQDYRGARIVWHGGAVFGSLAAVVLIPEKNVGFFIAVNSEEGEMVRGLMYELLDHYLGLPKDTWPEKLRDYKRDRLAEAQKTLAEDTAKPADVGPSLPPAEYAGDYEDPWYGTIAITENDGRLTIAFPHSFGLTAALEHWQYDTFRTRFEDEAIEPAYVTFALDAKGHVERITMKAVSPAADFSYDYHDLSFTPVKRQAAGAR